MPKARYESELRTVVASPSSRRQTHAVPLVDTIESVISRFCHVSCRFCSGANGANNADHATGMGAGLLSQRRPPADLTIAVSEKPRQDAGGSMSGSGKAEVL
jgi:hypothetical protein